MDGGGGHFTLAIEQAKMASHRESPVLAAGGLPHRHHQHQLQQLLARMIAATVITVMVTTIDLVYLSIALGVVTVIIIISAIATPRTTVRHTV